MRTVTNIEKARAQIVLDHPFVASILLRRPLIETDKVATMAVDQRANIYYNPKFTDTLTVPQLVWGLAHEVFHVVGKHFQRRGNRDQEGWNWAGDAWINETLDRANIGQRIPDTVDRKGSADQTVDEIYNSIPKGNSSGSGSGQGSGDGSMQGDAMGQDFYDNGESPLSESEAKEIEGQINREIAESAQAAKMRGKMPGWLQDIVSDIINSKIPWHSKLERYMVNLVKASYSWTRPNRRYMPNFYLPSTGTEAAMGCVVYQVDISGSISRQEIAHYNGHVKAIREQCMPEKTIVLYVDTDVHKVEEFGPDDEFQINFYSGGGTDMTAGIAYLEKEGIEPDVMVTLTDGYTPWPEVEPSFPTVWCISAKHLSSPVGESIHFELD